MKALYLGIACISVFLCTIYSLSESNSPICAGSMVKNLSLNGFADWKNNNDQATRESITFILGEDEETDNLYYTEATNYYKLNETGRTKYLVTSCRSLLEVRDHLEENPPSNGLPWGLINLVSHGNQWLGLSVKVTPHSKRSTPERIREYIENDSLRPLPNYLMDEKSEIYIHGCGIGNNPQLLDIIGEAFAGDDSVPLVNASKLFEYYRSVYNSGMVLKSERYQAKTWMVTYKMGYRPDDITICNMLKNKYPESTIDWRDALSRQQPRFNGDVYHYTFEVPVKWIIPFEHRDSLPDISSREKELELIWSRKEITDGLQKIELPAETFNWWLRTIRINNEDGSTSPAVWVKGYCTILCVIKPMLQDEDFVTRKHNETIFDTKHTIPDYKFKNEG